MSREFGKDAHRSDGSLRENEVRRKKQAILNLVNRIPDNLDRPESDIIKVVVNLLSRLIQRAHARQNRPHYFDPDNLP